MRSMKGRVAIVTGIGLAVARAFAENGANLLITGRRAGSIEAAASAQGAPSRASGPQRPIPRPFPPLRMKYELLLAGEHQALGQAGDI